MAQHPVWLLTPPRFLNLELLTISRYICCWTGLPPINECFHKSILSNEITALPELIKILDVAGCIVTIDAMGCQREIVKKIVEKDADYVIAVNKNQPTLPEQIKQLFKQAIETHGEDLNMSSFNSRELNRGIVGAPTIEKKFAIT